MTLSQTKAALILQQISPVIKEKCTNDVEYVGFLHNLCKAYFSVYGKYPLAYADKMAVIFAFTNASYFMWKGFISTMEDEIFNTTIVGQLDGNMPGTNEEYLKGYFGKKLSGLFEFEYSGGLNIVLNDDEASTHPFPDLAILFKKELPVFKKLLEEKPKVLTFKEYREFLVYYLVKLFFAYQDKTGSVPQQLLDEAYKEIQLLCMDTFNLPYKFVSPEEEILENYKSGMLVEVTNKYFEFINE